jgi:8-oxo-dGTP pyrophosphatase MutT (NUDIX family)
VGEVFRGRLVSVEVREGRYREIVHHPGSCAVVALVQGDVLLVRQYRDAIDQETLEIPAGIRDVDGEDAGGCAARELLEETGYRVARLEPLASIHASPGFVDERIDVFLGDAEPAGRSEAGIEVVRMPLDRAVEAVRTGEITDAKSAVGILLAAGRPA